MAKPSPAQAKAAPIDLVRPSRPKGRPAHGGVGRPVIVEKALELLKTTPPAKISLSSVARAAGCDPALIRYYFSDLQGVLVAAAAAISEQMHIRAEAAVHDPALGRRERLRALVGIYLSVFLDHPYQHQLFVELAPPRRSEAAALHAGAVSRVYAELSAVLDAAVADGEPKVDPVFAYVAIFGMIEFFVTHAAIRKTLRPEANQAHEAEAYADFIVDLFAPPPRA